MGIGGSSLRSSAGSGGASSPASEEAGATAENSAFSTLDSYTQPNAEDKGRGAELTSIELLASEPTTAERLLGDVDGNAAMKPPEEAAKSPDETLDEYQVANDNTTQWLPKLGPFTFIDVLVIEPREITETEAGLLDDLGSRKGVIGLNEFKAIRDDAFDEVDKFFPGEDAKGNPIPGQDDGHNDAFRHTLWNARMTKSFGEEFATAFATAHEGIPSNEADREAMDLYNNEVGRRIAVENPGATDTELSELVAEAVKNGESVVIDGNNNLAYSDQVAVGSTGTADDLPAGGGKKVPEVALGSW